MKRVLWLLLVLLCNCTSEEGGTDLTVHVTSDLSVPEELDRVTISVIGQTVEEDPAADLNKTPLPRSLTLVHEGGPLGPLQITVRGFLGRELVVQKDVVAWFVEGAHSDLTVQLARACVARVCGAAEACDDGACVPIDEPDDAAVPRDGGRDASMDAMQPPPRDAAPDANELDARPSDDAQADADADTTPDASDAAKPDASDAAADTAVPPPGPGAPPVCTLTLPVVGDSYQVNKQVMLRGSCSDPETGSLSTGLSWTSTQDGLLGSSASLDVSLKNTGVHRLTLCAADPRDSTLVGCAGLDVSVSIGEQPSVMISGLAQTGTMAPPFRTGAAIVFTGVGSGAGVTLSWSDDLQGALGSGPSVSLSTPLVGRHTVTLTVRDRAGVTRSATRPYTVVGMGESNLLSPYGSVNTTLDNAGDPDVPLIASDPLSRVYVPSSSGPLYRFDGSALAGSGVVAIGQPPLRAVVQDAQIVADKNLGYLATADGLTVCAYTATGGVVEPCTSYARNLLGLTTPDLRSVLRMTDSTGTDRLLLGTSSGLFFADNVAGSNRGSTILRGRVISDMVPLAGQAALAVDNGLYLLNVAAQSAVRLTTSDGLVNNAVRSLALGSDGSLWIGTAGGLSHYEPNAMGNARWTSYTTSNGLGDNRVSSVAVQRVTQLTPARDVVWVATSAGLVRLDTSANTLSRFTTADGLPSNEVLAAHVLANGDKVFGTSKGLVRFSGP